MSANPTGDILDIKLPNDPKGENKGHRGFAFLTYSNAEDAADAIDNYDLNELPGFVGQGKFLKCSIANPDKFGMGEGGKGRDKPSTSLSPGAHHLECMRRGTDIGVVWQTEEWLQEHGQKDVEEANGTITES